MTRSTRWARRRSAMAASAAASEPLAVALICSVARPLAAAQVIAAASRLLLINTAGVAASRPSRQAATIARMLVPLWEARKPRRGFFGNPLIRAWPLNGLRDDLDPG